MALNYRRLLAVMLWAAVALAMDASVLAHGLDNARKFGYYIEIPSYKSLTKLGGGKYKLRDPVVKIGLLDPKNNHTITELELHEGKGVRDMEYKKRSKIGKKTLQNGFIECSIPVEIEVQKGNWYTVSFIATDQYGGKSLVYLLPRECPSLEPYLKADPDSSAPATTAPTSSRTPYSGRTDNTNYSRDYSSGYSYSKRSTASGLLVLLIGLAIVVLGGFLFFYCCCGSSKRSSR
ncbi:hypothetical protein PAPHI01_2588 [Pancytospora philotis]|nr:hypothetical protein PAPHI01_2588 [Pancytospora philotis]